MRKLYYLERKLHRSIGTYQELYVATPAEKPLRIELNPARNIRTVSLKEMREVYRNPETIEAQLPPGVLEDLVSQLEKYKRVFESGVMIFSPLSSPEERFTLDDQTRLDRSVLRVISLMKGYPIQHPICRLNVSR